MFRFDCGLWHWNARHVTQSLTQTRLMLKCQLRGHFVRTLAPRVLYLFILLLFFSYIYYFFFCFFFKASESERAYLKWPTTWGRFWPRLWLFGLSVPCLFFFIFFFLLYVCYVVGAKLFAPTNVTQMWCVCVWCVWMTAPTGTTPKRLNPERRECGRLESQNLKKFWGILSSSLSAAKRNSNFFEKILK